MINYISHKKSKQIVNGLPKLPTANQLKEGEIAINYANGYETLSIKNSDNEITTFSSTEQIEKYVDTKLGSGFTGENFANTVTSVIEKNEKIAASALNDLNDRKLDSSAYTPTDLSDYYKKEETSGKTELTTAFNSKANQSDLTAHTDNSTVHITSDERTKWNGKISNAQYNKTDKKIYFYSGATTETPISNIDATDFIKDGMVSNVEIKDVTNSGSCLVITFNADAGKQDITIPVTKIFNPANYYLKSETSGKTELDTAFGLKANTTDLTAHTSDSTIHITSAERTKWNNAATSSHTHANKSVLDTITAIDKELSETSNNLVVNSAITKVLIDNEKVVSASLNDLNERKLDASAYTPTDLSDYYKKEETSGKTELDAALALKANTSDLATKANTSDLTAHTSNSNIHITADERTKWNNAATSSHTHANKAILDKITAIDTELSETSNNLVVNSAITKVIVANEKISSSALNDLNDRKLDASAYTPTDLSDYYKKEETSGKTDLNTAFGLKANVSDLTAHTGNNDIHITADERTKWNNAATNSHTHTNKDVLDTIAAIDSELNENSKNLVVNSAITTVILENEKIVSTSLNDLNDRKLDASAYTPTDLSDYYKKEETSGKTELTAAFNSKANSTDLATKANQSDLTAHTGNSTVHITSDERTKWNNAATNSHTHANKDVLDKITAIDTELSKTSGNLVVNSAITKVIVDNEKIVSASLNDLNDRKLDASAYTPTDLSDYYKKEETSGKTEITNALNAKANTGHTHTSNDITDKVTEITVSNSGSTSVPTVSAVMQKLNELNATITQLQTTVQDYKTRIEALEGKNSNNASQS